jgi:broad-specificity NMP kinase
MRERALIHVSGTAGAGKTIFVRRLLDAEIALAICVRAERDAKLRKEQESAPPTRAELRRYRDAGESAVALYRFAE